MNEYLKCNRKYLLDLKPKSIVLLIVTMLITILIIGASIFIKTYENYNVLGIFVSEDESIYIDVPLSNLDKVTTSEYILINKEKYKYKLLTISEVKYDEYLKINYQTLRININKNLINNEVVKLNFYYNKERIIKKILNIF